ncbi:MAG: MBL fold metallo-hydrolase [Clostridiales Family XIII bacterium]|nr:MBL fold metallo-hydrolase [Clostridiales Family XIII bacterium]
MIEIIPVTGCTGSECYLLVSENHGFLVDTGYAFCADATAQNIANALGARTLDYILLTHSHYDHVGGLSAMRRTWPKTEVVASRYAKDILSRRRARDVIRSLDDKAAAKRGGIAMREDFTAGFAVDRTVKEGDVLYVDGISISVMETPGHTKCSVSYYFREDDLLVLSESTGIRPVTSDVSPTFIVSYRDVIKAIDRSERMAPRRILIAHSGSESGDGVKKYFKDARAAAEAVAEWILAEHKLGKSLDEIIESYTAEFFIGSANRYQPLEAFVLNARTMIPRLIEEFERSQ